MADNNNVKNNRMKGSVGLLFIIFCIIGIITVFGWCFRFSKNLADDTQKKSKYEAMVLPIVMYDPADFIDSSTCDNEFLLQSSIWACVLSEDSSQYQYDEFNRLIIPASDISAKAKSLFGPGAVIIHQTIGDIENPYLYDEDIGSYHVPVVSMSGFATPRVDAITVKGETCILHVGYVAPTTLLSTTFNANSGAEVVPSKYVDFELHKEGNEYYLYSMTTDSTSVIHEEYVDYSNQSDSLEDISSDKVILG